MESPGKWLWFWKVLEILVKGPGKSWIFFRSWTNRKQAARAEKPLNFIVQSAVYSLRELTTNVYICEKLSDILVISQ